jgi:hypothetical protein
MDKFRKIKLRVEVTPDSGISVRLHAESAKRMAFQ